jgi:predicted kinase
MPVSHASLIVGPTGAGKTTYARQLTERERGVRFSIDEWMARCFWPDAPPEPDYAWALARVARCEAQILDVCAQLRHAGLHLVLDLGFFSREQRARITDGLHAAGLQTRLHLLQVPAAVRWSRVVQRNAEQGETYALQVDRQTFDFAEGLFEPLSPEEQRDATVIRQD